MGNQSVHATLKVSPPLLQDCYARRRLFAALDSARRRSIVWITAPAGAGKTTLVASYLQQRGLGAIWYTVDRRDDDLASFFHTFRDAVELARPGLGEDLPRLAPEHTGNPGVFVRQYFEALYGRLGEAVALVVDDVQELDEESPWWVVLRDGLASLPAGLNLIGISRQALPPPLSRRQAGGDVELLGWEDLRLDPEETEAMARVLDNETISALPEEGVRSLHNATRGWAAGVVLALEWMRRTGDLPETLDSRPPASVFDYFASEVFETLEPSTRRFLLETAVLPLLTPALAEALTGQQDSGPLLRWLNRQNYFTIRRRGVGREETYQYHPLFRAFLLEQGRLELSADAVQRLHARAVALLEQHGYLEEAIELGLDRGEWEAARALVLRRAPEIIREFRYQTLDGWLSRFPAERRRVDGWLLHWRGVTQRQLNPARAVELLQQALALFREQGNAEGCSLAWAEWVESIVWAGQDMHPLDRALEVIADLRQQGLVARDPRVESRVAVSTFAALFWRQPGHPEIERWMELAREALIRTTSTERRANLVVTLWMYHFMRGEVAAAERVLDVLTTAEDWPGPVARMIHAALRACDDWVRGNLQHAEAILEQGHQVCEQTGVAFWQPMLFNNQATCALLRGDIDGARRIFEALEPHFSWMPELQKGHTYSIRAWVALESGRPAEAQRWILRWEQGEEAQGHVVQVVYRECSRAQALFDLGDREAALRTAEQALDTARTQRFALYEFMALWTLAHFQLQQGPEAAAREALGRALRFGRERGLVCTPNWRREFISQLCAAAIEWDLEPRYAEELIRLCGLAPPPGLVRRGAWPWPFQIVTMGRFSLRREGREVTFGRKAPRRPLELLKVLLAMGGREVPVEQLADALWPNAEGDAAQRSLQTTLHRLRALLGEPEVLLLQDGKLSLDGRRCWVDLWELEELLSRPSGEDSGGDGALQAMADRLLELYRGPFLVTEGDSAWYLPPRDRLGRRFSRAAAELGRRLERPGDWDRARRHYERAIDLDELAEPHYQGLMRSLLALEDPAGAVSVFRQLEQRLRDRLDHSPSESTRALLARANQQLQ